MPDDFIYILFFGGVGTAFVAGAFIVSALLRPRSGTDPAKLSTYECGEVVKGPSHVQFNIRYYLFALIFVIFDVEVLFVVPWAVVFKELGMIAYVEMLIFISILTVGLAYAWKKGALEWQ